MIKKSTWTQKYLLFFECKLATRASLSELTVTLSTTVDSILLISASSPVLSSAAEVICDASSVRLQKQRKKTSVKKQKAVERKRDDREMEKGACTFTVAMKFGLKIN